MFVTQLTRLGVISFLALPFTGCQTIRTSVRSDLVATNPAPGEQVTTSSLRSELEQRDSIHSQELASSRRAAERGGKKPAVNPTHTQGGLSQRIYRRKEWGALLFNPAKLDIVGGRWEKITVHHSDEVGALIFNGTFSQSAEAVRSIQRQHLQGNRWGDIGYHYVIDARGRIFEGRPLDWQGAHAGDRAKNRRNLGVCLLGNFNKTAPSVMAREALRGLLEDLRKLHSIPLGKVYVHSDFTSTECPGHHLTKWVKSYRESKSLSHSPR